MIKLVVTALDEGQEKTILSSDTDVPKVMLPRVKSIQFFPSGGFNNRAPAYFAIDMGTNPKQNNQPVYRIIPLPDTFNPARVRSIQMVDTDGQIKPLEFSVVSNDLKNPWLAQQPEVINTSGTKPTPIQFHIEKSFKDNFMWIVKLGVNVVGSLAYVDVHANQQDLTEDNLAQLQGYLMDLGQEIEEKYGKPAFAIDVTPHSITQAGPTEKQHSTFTNHLVDSQTPEHAGAGSTPVRVDESRQGLDANAVAARAPFNEQLDNGQDQTPIGANPQTYGLSSSSDVAQP